MKKEFDKAYLQENLDLPYDNIIEDKIIDTSRWSAIHEIIFQDTDKKYWRTWYSAGLTELQDEYPWEDKDKILCEQVEKKMIQVEAWVPIKED